MHVNRRSLDERLVTLVRIFLGCVPEEALFTRSYEKHRTKTLKRGTTYRGDGHSNSVIVRATCDSAQQSDPIRASMSDSRHTRQNVVLVSIHDTHQLFPHILCSSHRSCLDVILTIFGLVSNKRVTERTTLTHLVTPRIAKLGSLPSIVHRKQGQQVTLRLVEFGLQSDMFQQRSLSVV